MTSPTLLFAYRLGSNQGRRVAKCICCDPYSAESWSSSVRLRGIDLYTRQIVEVEQVCSDDSLPLPKGPGSVYGDDSFMSSVKKSHRLSVIVAQNLTYVTMEPYDEGIETLPFFISFSRGTTPYECRATIALSNSDVSLLPDVQVFNRRHSMSLIDKWSRLFVPDLQGESVPFPIGALFPATLVSGGRECGVVYAVDDIGLSAIPFKFS